MVALRRAGEPFAAPQEVAKFPWTGFLPSATIDDRGHVTIALRAPDADAERPNWNDPNSFNQVAYRAWVAEGDVNAGMGEPFSVSGYGDHDQVTDVALAGNRAGDTLVGWTGAPHYPNGHYPPGAYVAERGAGGAFGGPALLEGDGRSSPNLASVALADGGAAAIGWVGYCGDYAQVRPPGGDWSPPRLLTSECLGEGAGRALGFDVRGRLVAAGGFSSGRRSGLTVTRWRPGDEPEPPVELGDPAGHNSDASLGFDASGNGVVAWMGSSREAAAAGDDFFRPILLSLYDGSRPAITSLVPPTAETGFGVRLSEPARVALRVYRLRGNGRATRLGVLRARRARGRGRVPLSRPLARRLARPGRYRAVATARDSAGKRSRPRRVEFKALR